MVILGLYRDNGKENGNYHTIIGYILGLDYENFFRECCAHAWLVAECAEQLAVHGTCSSQGKHGYRPNEH